jgi:DNA-directed RNA polymerase specialized sigma24 family protein
MTVFNVIYPLKGVSMKKEKEVSPKKTPKKTTRKKGKYYIDRKQLMAVVISCKEKDIMSDEFATMLTLLTKKYATSSKYAGYTFNTDMQAYAMMMLVRTWRSFKPEKSDNPFAFYTQCIKHSFIQYLKNEKKHRNIRDKMMVSHGLNPSLSYQMAHTTDRHLVDDEEDHDQVVATIDKLNDIP